MRPMEFVEVEDDALNVLKLEKIRVAVVVVWPRYVLDPEDGVHLRRVGVLDDERYVHDATGSRGSGRDDDHVGLCDVLSLDLRPEDFSGILDRCGSIQAFRQALRGQRVIEIRPDGF